MKGFDMRIGSPVHAGNSLDGSAQGKATLVTSRRSFLAGSKLVAGAARWSCLGLADEHRPAKPNPNAVAADPERAKAETVGLRGAKW